MMQGSVSIYQQMGAVRANPRAALMGFGPDRSKLDHQKASSDAREQGALMEPGSVRSQLYRLQEQVGRLPEAELPLTHTFAKGCYARTMFMPAGTVLVGKIHRFQHITCLSQGEASVFSESGGAERMEGFRIWTTEPGTKRAIYAHTDVLLTTFHVTDLTDPDEIEDALTVATFEEVDQIIAGDQS